MFYLTLNRGIVIRKCYSLKTFMLLTPALAAFELMQLLWLASQGHISVWARACTAYIARHSALREARAITQRTRLLGDGEILRDARLPLTQHARASFAGRYLVPVADVFLRPYWRLVRNRI